MKSFFSTILLSTILSLGLMAQTSTGPAPATPGSSGSTSLGVPSFSDFGILFDNLNHQFLSIPTSAFSSYNGLFTASGFGFFAGDIGQNNIYYVADYYTNNLYTVNVNASSITLLAPITGMTSGHVITSMTYDANSGKMYFGTTDISTSTLYTLNLTTGQLTAIGSITNCPCIIDFAINSSGNLYGIDIVNDNFLEINTTTAAGTIIGSLGYDANYAQGMDFNDATGELYWAASGENNEIRKINLSNGSSTLVASFPSSSYDALAIGDPSTVPVSIYVVLSLFVLLGSIVVIRFFWK